MGYWATATGKENAKEFYEDNRVVDRCKFCGPKRNQNHYDNRILRIETHTDQSVRMLFG